MRQQEQQNNGIMEGTALRKAEISRDTLQLVFNLFTELRGTEPTRKEFDELVMKYVYNGEDIEKIVESGDCKITPWYWKTFKDDSLRDKVFAIEEGMWSIKEYNELDLSAVRGIGKCAVCGKITNVMDNKTGKFICSNYCLKKLKH